MNNMSRSSTALILAIISVWLGGAVMGSAQAAPQPHASQHASVSAHKKNKTHHKARSKSHQKSSAKTAHKVTPLDKPQNTKFGKAKPIDGIPDPNVDEPSQMITAIKNRAQDQFWAGKRPYPEQLRERIAPPPAETVLTGAMAQNELQKRGIAYDISKNEAGRSDSLRRVTASEIAGVTFDDQPLRMNASEAFRRSLDTVSFELGRPCKDQEYYGWPMQQSEQDRVNRIFEETNAKFKLRGFSVTPRAPRSVGRDVSAFTADRLDKRILGLWSAGDVGLLLLMCNAETPQEAAYAAKLKAAADLEAAKQGAGKTLKKSGKRTGKYGTLKSRKKTTRKLERIQARPQVHPGVGRQDNKPEASGMDVNHVEPTPMGATQPDAPKPMQAVNTDSLKPQVVPGAPPKALPAEPSQSMPAASVPINPSAAFIPADVPTPSAPPASTDVKP